MKRTWPKIAIILLTITVAAGFVTPLFGNVFTELFSSPSKTVEVKSPEGSISTTLDLSSSNSSGRGNPSAVMEIGSFIMLGGGMLTLASWGRRKFRR